MVYWKVVATVDQGNEKVLCKGNRMPAILDVMFFGELRKQGKLLLGADALLLMSYSDVVGCHLFGESIKSVRQQSSGCFSYCGAQGRLELDVVSKV